MKNIKEFSIYQLIHLSIIAIGMQYVVSTQLNNMSMLYQYLGASSSSIAKLGIIPPFIGLFVQPIIGQLSDDTFSIYGKRRPYIFIWTLIGCLACILIMFSSFLWLTFILMTVISSSYNGAVETTRALIGDIIIASQKVKAFAFQTIFAGIGAGIAALIPYLFAKYFPNHASFQYHSIPLSLKLSFLLGGILWLATMLWTVITIKEKISHKGWVAKITAKENILKKSIKLFKRIVKNIKKMPLVLQQFSIIQFFTWLAIYSIWIFFPLAIAQHFYGLPNADSILSPELTTAMENGRVSANFYIGIYQIVSIIYSILLIYLNKKISSKILHGISLVIGALGLLCISFIAQKYVAICMIAIGIMWGSIITLPYSIIASEIPRYKMGIYFGIFNISITLPQIVASLTLDFIYAYLFRFHAIYMIIFGGLFIFIAGSLTI